MKTNKLDVYKTKRIYFIDYMRAFCMLWIIAFWHMCEYCDILLTKYHWANNLTIGVLGTFTLISGFFCGCKDFNTSKTVASFYKRRFIRIYPLFFLSCTTLYLLHIVNAQISYISSLKQFMYTLLGITTFMQPTSYTVWYISMLLLLYLISPFLQYKTKYMFEICMRMLFVYLIVCIWYVVIGCDARILYLYPMFFLGLLCGSKRNNIRNVSNIGVQALAIYFILSISIFSVFLFIRTSSSQIINVITNIIISISVSGCIGIISIILSIFLKCVLIRKCLEVVSIGSFVAYLFHRQFFGAIYLIIGNYPYSLAYFVILPGLVIGSYVIQKQYDYLIEKLN
ncbi:acyltransferase [[Clostridium] spiroforme]|nr:acyltransferase [Thomasclavelia spiroformis]